jgi:hypothetical protein
VHKCSIMCVVGRAFVSSQVFASIWDPPLCVYQHRYVVVQQVVVDVCSLHMHLLPHQSDVPHMWPVCSRAGSVTPQACLHVPVAVALPLLPLPSLTCCLALRPCMRPFIVLMWPCVCSPPHRTAHASTRTRHGRCAIRELRLLVLKAWLMFCLHACSCTCAEQAVATGCGPNTISCTVRVVIPVQQMSPHVRDLGKW